VTFADPGFGGGGGAALAVSLGAGDADATGALAGADAGVLGEAFADGAEGDSGGFSPPPQAPSEAASGIRVVAARVSRAAVRVRVRCAIGCYAKGKLGADGKRKACALSVAAMAVLLTVDPRRPDAGTIAEAARVLLRGGLVAFPTETVYGLGARAFDEEAVARVFSAKGRPFRHPLIAHVEGEARARELARWWPERASALARAFWPGPLTLVVERAPHVPAAVAGGGDSIAVRAPAHPVARALIAALGEPIAAPSANRYQGLSPTTAAHVVRQLGGAVDLVLDGGPCEAGIESTVVDLRGERPLALRPGALAMAALRAVLPDLEVRIDAVTVDEVRASPGMGMRHYAPRARLLMRHSWQEARRTAFSLAAGGACVALIVHEAEITSVPSGRVVLRTLPHDPVRYAHELYGTLHDLDEEGVDVIVVQDVPADEAWWAVADRLRRGAVRSES
jgi:L-threonylcarbamoyladenylate synthase